MRIARPDRPGPSPLGCARARLEPLAALPPSVAARLEEADLGAEEAYLVWQFVALAGDLGPSEREALAAVVADSLVAVGQGSTRLRVPNRVRPVFERVPDLVGPPGSRRPLVFDGTHLYHHKHFVSEEQLAARLRARLAAPRSWSAEQVDLALRAVEQREARAAAGSAASRAGAGDEARAGLSEARGSAAGSRTRLDDEQRAALRSVLGRPLAVVSGPPGSGKTTLALALVRTLVELGVSAEAIALAAPTGKAANRLQEAVAGGLAAVGETALLEALPAAATLHRLLGYSPSARAFAHRETSPLPHRVVIVDESSMVDLILMDHLLRALKPETSLLLLGDADQLPSVDAGAVFRDLAPFGVHLTRSHRLDASQPRGRRILDLAAAVRAGEAPALEPRDTAAAVTFDAPELIPASEREPLLERWYSERLAASPDLEPVRAGALPLGEAGFSLEASARLDALHAHYQRFRLLAVTRGRPTGAMALNAWMHQRAGAFGPAPIPGEPILMLRNDYDRSLWNGDQGLCVRVREEGRPPRAAAAFKVRDRWTAWHLDSLRDSLTLAYALTVHKAQGSEHDHIALFLPDVPLALTSRELLYTALTRTRHSLVLCASPQVLTAATAQTHARSSGLPEKLGAA